MAVRVVSPYKLKPFTSERSQSWFSCCGSRDLPSLEVCPDIDRVIIHVHAGGFIAMTSRSHQNYIRKWAVETKTPILCVDYRLAPKYPFPCALDDVWQTYVWVVNHAEEYLGITPKKIILAGDSAGGNLAMGCALRAIETGIRRPDGLLLNYPALNMWKEAFTPSFLISLDDVIMHHTFLKLCHDCYLPDRLLDTKDNKYVSPLFAEDSLLSQFPPTRLMIGTKDPLIDDCWRLVERLDSVHVNVKMTIFTGLIHGGMNSSIRNGVQDGIRMVDQGGVYLKDLLR